MRTCALQYVHHVSHSKCTHIIQGHRLQGCGEGGGVLQTWMWVLPELCSCIHTEALPCHTCQCSAAREEGVRHGSYGPSDGIHVLQPGATQHNEVQASGEAKRKECISILPQWLACMQTHLPLHDIGDFHLKAIRAQYVSEGLVPRVHGHTGCVSPNALVLDEVKGIITFVMQYVETNAILLPGRIPGYKRDDIKLLPSSCTKRAVWVLYQESATSLSLRSVAYTTFCKVWRNFMGDVVVCKPMSDLCETCQKNSASIVRSFNKSEEEKSEV